MENVVQFPTKSVRDWLIIERSMKEAFLSMRISSAAQIRISENLKSFYEILDPQFTFSVPVTFPSSIPRDQIAAICSDAGEKLGVLISEQLQAFTKKLFFDRLHREIDICREFGIL